MRKVQKMEHLPHFERKWLALISSKNYLMAILQYVVLEIDSQLYNVLKKLKYILPKGCKYWCLYSLQH